MMCPVSVSQQADKLTVEKKRKKCESAKQYDGGKTKGEKRTIYSFFLNFIRPDFKIRICDQSINCNNLTVGFV